MHQLVSCDPTAQDEPEKNIKKYIFFTSCKIPIHLNMYIHTYIHMMYKQTYSFFLFFHYTHTLTHNIYPVDFGTKIASQNFSSLWTISLLSIKLIFSPLMGVSTPLKRSFFKGSKISPVLEASHRWLTYIVFHPFWKSRWNHKRDHPLHSQKFWGYFTGVIRLKCIYVLNLSHRWVQCYLFT